MNDRLSRQATRLKTIAVFTAVILTATFVATGQKIFDGKKKAVLRTHDSVDGGSFLQDHLTRHNGGDAALMKVYDPGQNARSSDVDTVKGGGYVFQTASKNDWLSRAGSMINSAKSNAGCSDCEVVFFAQCTYDPIVVVDTNDAAQVDKAVRLMKFVCDEIRKAGATYVFFSTMHYQYSHRPFAENEPFVMREFNSRFKNTTNYRAVDCVTPTIKGWPLSSCGDKRHPTGYGKQLMSDAYFRAMLEFDGISDVPAYSAEMIEEARVEWSKGRDWADKYLHLPPPGRYKIGDTLVVRWDQELCKYDAGQYSNILVALQFHRTDKAQTGGVNLSHFIQIETAGGARFTSGATGQSERADCDGSQNYVARIPVTRALFDNFGPYKNVPMPIIINASFHQVYQYHWKGSDSNLDSAAQHIFYPSTSIDLNLPVYPNVNPDGSAVGVNTPVKSLRSDAAPVVRVMNGVTEISHLPASAGKLLVFDVAGGILVSRVIGGDNATVRIPSIRGVAVIAFEHDGVLRPLAVSSAGVVSGRQAGTR